MSEQQAATRVSSSTDAPDTRQRLLEAAGEVFAEHGFRDATIRDICARAGANLAAVNYHFRDKEGLYRQVVHYAHDQAMHARLKELQDSAAMPAPRRLALFVRSFLQRTCDAGRPAWHGKLMVREMIEPTHVLDEIVDQAIRPMRENLHGIIRALLGSRAEEALVQRCAFSIVGQCLFYPHCRPVIQRLQPQLRYTPAEIELLAEHVTGFSLAALKQLRRGLGRLEGQP
jgi:AcrR family transcriptional regulator